MKSHFVLLLIFSLMISVFFALLLKEGKREVLKYSAIWFALMVGISLAVAWLMYPFS